MRMYLATKLHLGFVFVILGLKYIILDSLKLPHSSNINGKQGGFVQKFPSELFKLSEPSECGLMLLGREILINSFHTLGSVNKQFKWH